MSSLATRARFEPQRSLAFGSIGATYMGVGTALTQPARTIFIQNLTDATLQFSVDGVNDHFPLYAYSPLTLDVTANKAQPVEFGLSVGDRLYVKTITAPTKGAVYFSVLYGSLD